MKPCEWCTRFTGHFEWCPATYLPQCICQTEVVPAHRFGMSTRCLYVNDAADPDREWRGVMWTAKQRVGVEPCHWPNPVDPNIIMRTADCLHGTHPWEYAA